MGKHWAIETDDGPEFIRGDRPTDPQDAESAEKSWRKMRKLFFIPATVRRTTDEEDASLQRA